MLIELTMFAAVGFCIGGSDDVLIDVAWLFHRTIYGTTRRQIDGLPHPTTPGRFAIFVPTWEEAGVIGAMLSTTLARVDHPDYCIYVACYPNDRDTIAVVSAIAARDSRVRLVVGDRPGPTTKADNLNTLWRALRSDDARDGTVTRAVVLHDAEDVVDAAELTVHDALLGPCGLVQIPVLPLIDPEARMVSGQNLQLAEIRHFLQRGRENRVVSSQWLTRRGKTAARYMLSTPVARAA